jgi:FkbM family methyltransferase
MRIKRSAYRKRLIKIINRMLWPLGAKVVRRDYEGEAPLYAMSSMLRRLAARGYPVRSIVDIGASDGKWSLMCMQYFPDAMYLAVEPLAERENALQLKKRELPNFDYALCVAGAADGQEVALHVTSDLDGSTVNAASSASVRTCVTRTIDSLVRERNLPGPYLLKFDTHGYEVPILSGATNTLAETAGVILECYNFEIAPTAVRFPGMCSHMEHLGFRVADVADPMLRSRDNVFWQMDMLFLKADEDVFRYSSYEY